jgi:RNA polymerase sigma-70 factor, ECF subfamily
MASTTFADEIVQNLSRLESFARRLAGNRSFADDLVQETVLRALVHADQFRPGTNLLAWLTTILRNAYFNEKRRQRRIGPLDPTVVTSSSPTINDEQEWHLRMRDVTCRFANLPAAQREALVLVGANGYSYDHAAKVAGCAVGTMKSRVSRARSELQRMLEHGDAPASSREIYGRDLEHLDEAA